MVAVPVVLVLAVVFLVVSTEEQPAVAAAGRTCSVGMAADGTVAGFGEESLAIAESIVSVGAARGLPPQAWQIAVQAGMAESGLRNLDYGDRDSLGIFQMRPSMGWGTPEQLQDVHYQINKFFDVLLEVPGWEDMRPGEAAQAVERSAFPERYHEFEVAAQQVLGTVQGIECGTLGSDAAAAVLSAATDQLGVPYAWGGGTLDGPGPGIEIDAGVVGFDCSALVRYAFHQGTRGAVTLPRTSREQYAATSGADLTGQELLPGDLLFYGTGPSTIHHVALYLGDGQMVEAPESGSTVRIAPARLDGDFYRATRVL
ncbi:NlpC/P60 family protein [Prauserella marina]|uniref:NlpC/P60 family protein n=1 Tax=Prauserella marina TaxID=530584 RepID=UPI001FEAE67B|nr:NlpC/P60 family protein [Prauserella marina]